MPKRELVLSEQHEMDGFLQALKGFQDGYVTGFFEQRQWGVTVKRSPNGKRGWLYAEELGGDGIVSANFYHLEDGRHLLKPCEMAREAVIAFVCGFKPKL